tara:strand:+ start:298 stop:471 length:174 start_codon:yes stop_codon:yes gene_type:complete
MIMALSLSSIPDWIYALERFSIGIITLGLGVCLLAFGCLLFGMVFEMMSAKIKEVMK